MKIGADNIHATSAQVIMKRTKARGVSVVVYVPTPDDAMFSEVTYDPVAFPTHSHEMSIMLGFELTFREISGASWV